MSELIKNETFRCFKAAFARFDNKKMSHRSNEGSTMDVPTIKL
jgi:hypothetical protein